jgi:hypothetical protein
MKTRRILAITISLILLIGISGCDNNDIVLEIKIDKELPVLYSGCNLAEGQIVIINSQEDLDKIYKKENISQLPEFQNIDFTKYSLITGAKSYNRGIAKLEHQLMKTGNTIYDYRLKIYYNLTLPAGTFYYGIMVSKIPSDAKVYLDVEEIEP